MKRLLLLIFMIFSGKLFGFTILIDPGHGGEDKGAQNLIKTKTKSGSEVINIYEKDLALNLSKKIYELLKKNHNTYMTRSLDRTVSLEKRAEMAEKLKADLYVSIHLNSSPKPYPNGFETYYLDNHNDLAVKKVEAIENKDLTGEEKVINQILIDLVVDRTVDSSRAFARSIHNSVKKKVASRYRLIDRGVKPGLFYVLALAKRPAVLLEIGFMSNNKELEKLTSEQFQWKYAKAIANGIENYVKKQKPATPSFL